MFGRGLMADLVGIDRQLVAIARHRSRSGDRPRNSARYRGLVTRLRGTLKTRINAALNRVVLLHTRAELVVERLDFRLPDLSARMNRLVQNCGRALFRQKLVDLKDQFGIVASEVACAYSSQECSKCRFVDRLNHRPQSEFRCRFCGSVTHADVNGARVAAQRRSLGSDAKRVTKGAIVADLVRRFRDRWKRPQGAADDPRWTNPLSRDWAVAARKLLPTQGLEPCVQKQ